MMIAAYIKQHPGSPPMVKQHLAAIWMLFGWLVTGQLVSMNPASPVRGPKHIAKRGKTSVLTPDEARRLLDSIPIEKIAGLRDRANVFHMIQRRAKAAGLSDVSCHTFRATGITAYLENSGTIEKAQQIAGHESPRTTKLYDRTEGKLTLDEIEPIAI
jgi:site-specific recombinase XerC